MIRSLPINLYFDTFEPLTGMGMVTSSLIVTYDVFKINELRNYLNKTNVKTEDESPFIMAGVYVFVKIATSKPSLMFFDPTKNDLLKRSFLNTGNKHNDFVFTEIIKHITGNYQLLQGNVTLVQGVPPFLKPLPAQ
jgi:hypothetical protein